MGAKLLGPALFLLTMFCSVHECLAACNAPQGYIYELIATISGPDTVCVGTEVKFSVAVNAEAKSYSWGGAVSGSDSSSDPKTFNTAGNYEATVHVEGSDPAYDGPCAADDTHSFTVVKVESITGLGSLYCTHQDCSANLTAVLTSGAELPEGCSITWEGDADFSNQSGLTVTAKFANHAGKNKKITAKVGTQDPAAESSTYTVVDHTPVTGVTIVTYNFVYKAPTGYGVWGVTLPGDPVADVTAYFDHPSHTWKCKVTTSTCQIEQGSRRLPGVDEASVEAATTEAIYQKMRSDLISRGALPCSWYMLAAVEAHEKVHSDAWQAINDPLFTTFRNTVEALSVAYADPACDTPEEAKTAIKALSAYTTAYDKYVYDGTIAWNQHASIDPSPATNAAEDAFTGPMITALDAKAAAQTPPWTP